MLGPDVAPRHQIANPADRLPPPARPLPLDPAGELAALLGSHLVVTTGLGSTAGRVDAAGTYAGRWPYVEIAGLRLFLRTGDQLYASLTTRPAGLTRIVADETGPHPDTGEQLQHVERWCPTCAAWQPATPGPQEAAFWTDHAHHVPEHVTIEVAGDTAALHSPAAVGLAARWLTGQAGDVCIRLEPCDCDGRP